MAGVEAKNIACFCFENGSARPTLKEVANFVKTLDANPVDMEACYRIADEKAIFLKFKSEEAMVYAIRHNGGDLPFHYENGKVVKVQIAQAGGKTLYVRVYDLLPEVSDDAVVSVLSKYGKVKRIVREKFPVELGFDMQSGVRGIYMDVKSDIPSSLHFQNRKGNIFYEGNKNLCFLCNMEGHRMNSCPKRTARKHGKELPRENQVPQEDQRQQPDEEQAGSTSKDGVEKEQEEDVEILEEEVIGMDVPPPAEESDGTKEANDPKAKPPMVFKYPNDRYYYYKFGIVDYTERREEEMERKRQEEEAERRRQEEEAKVRSPPRKNRKNLK